MKKALTLLFALTTTLAVFAAEPTLSGAWTVENDIAGNESSVPMVLKQDGKKLTGETKMPDGKGLPLSGEIKEKTITWKYDTEWEGNILTMVYTGSVDASGKISGTVEVQPMGVEGTFIAKKAEVKPEPKPAPKDEKKIEKK